MSAAVTASALAPAAVDAAAVTPALTIVIPVRDEEASIAAVIEECLALSRGDGPWANTGVEIVVVDDGSSDDTWRVIAGIAGIAAAAPAAAATPAAAPAASAPSVRVLGVRLRRRCGKAAALRAGFDEARGAIIATLDGDGQDDAGELAKLRPSLEAGADIVGGARLSRADSAGKRLASKLFNTGTSLVTGVRLRDHNTGMKLMRADVARELPLHGELHRYMFVLAAHRGYRVAEVPVAHRARSGGRSKYGAVRALTSLSELVLVRAHQSIDGRAHQWLSLLGMTCALPGVLGLAYLFYTWVRQRVSPSLDYVALMDRPLLLFSVLAIVVAAQLLTASYLAALTTGRRITPPPIAERTARDANG